MAQERVELLWRWGEAFNARDLEALDDLIGPDFQFRPYLGALIETSVYQGPDGMRRYFADADAAWETIQAGEPIGVREVDDGRIVHWGELRGRGRSSGLEVRVQLAWVSELRDGRFVRIDSYASKAEALEAAGLAE